MDEKTMLYTDGSYNKDLGIYGSGFVLLDAAENEVTRGHHFGVPEPGNNGWNVNGEVAAAEMGIQKAIELGYTDITVYHDYEGIGKWADGLWRANKLYTRKYVENIQE